MIFLSPTGSLIPTWNAYDIFSGKITPENIHEYRDDIDLDATQWELKIN